jgi:hypothetical protein
MTQSNQEKMEPTKNKMLAEMETNQERPIERIIFMCSGALDQ